MMACALTNCAAGHASRRGVHASGPHQTRAHALGTSCTLLAESMNRSFCVANETFGCAFGRVWVSHGCAGTFRCGHSTVDCISSAEAKLMPDRRAASSLTFCGCDEDDPSASLDCAPECSLPCAACGEVARSLEADLSPFLQGNYSRVLYRRAHAVRTSELRMIWLHLLPPQALVVLARKGVCKVNTAEPSAPYYWGQSTHFGTPQDTIFIHHARLPRPLPSHSWAEVVHCPVAMQVGNMSLSGKHTAAIMPLWAYILPGSGLSVNIGRTLVLRSWQEAIELVHMVFGFNTMDHQIHDYVPPDPKVSLRILTLYDSVQAATITIASARPPADPHFTCVVVPWPLNLAASKYHLAHPRSPHTVSSCAQFF